MRKAKKSNTLKLSVTKLDEVDKISKEAQRDKVELQLQPQIDPTMRVPMELYGDFCV
jgi:hypothetical protein